MKSRCSASASPPGSPCPTPARASSRCGRQPPPPSSESSAFWGRKGARRRRPTGERRTWVTADGGEAHLGGGGEALPTLELQACRGHLKGEKREACRRVRGVGGERAAHDQEGGNRPHPRPSRPRPRFRWRLHRRPLDRATVDRRRLRGGRRRATTRGEASSGARSRSE